MTVRSPRMSASARRGRHQSSTSRFNNPTAAASFCCSREDSRAAMVRDSQSCLAARLVRSRSRQVSVRNNMVCRPTPYTLHSVAKEFLFYVRLGMSGVLIPVGLFLRDRSGIDADDHHATLHGVVFDILVRRTCFILRSRRGCATHSPRAKRGGPAWTRTRNQTVMSGRL